MQYVVKSGDTLSEISRKFYGTPYEYQHIVAANSFIKNADRIEIGWILEIPGQELIGPPSPNQPLMLPPGGSSIPSAPIPGLPQLPGVTPTASIPGPNKQAIMIAMVLASLVLGYFVMKHFAKEKEGKTDKPAREPSEEAA